MLTSTVQYLRKPRKGGSNISIIFQSHFYGILSRKINEDVREEAGMALMVRKGHWDPLLRPPILECFWHQRCLLAKLPCLLLPPSLLLSIWGGVLTVSWPRNPNFFFVGGKIFFAKKSAFLYVARKNVQLGRQWRRRTPINTGCYFFAI